MQIYKCALLCAILALSILEPITARTTFSSRHSYPKSGGHSDGGSHSYPRSGGLSASGGGSHSYPSSGGLSGNGGRGYPSSGGIHSYPTSGGSHSYPSSGGSHAYPASGGLSGNSAGRGYPSSGGTHSYPTSGGSHSYPQSGVSHRYPSSGGSHGYPASGGLSGNNNRGSGTTTNIHHHYHYSPPQSITYSPYHGASPVSYPVYRGTPPSYVYQYKDSGSKYGTLLAGLALLNLGTLAAGTAYAVSHSNSHSGGTSTYKTQPGEVCKFGLKKDNGDYEETRIDCQLISSFILAEQAKSQTAQQNSTSITTTTTVTNVTMTNNTNPVVQTAVPQQTTKVLYEMLPNGTLVPVNVPVTVPMNETAIANNPMTASVVTTTNTTTTNTTATNAIDVKGKPVDVTPGMQCFVIRSTPTSNMRKTVPCQVLQTYADKSIQRNSATRSVPTFAMFATVMAAFVLNV